MTTPQVYARTAGALYVVTIVAGMCALLGYGGIAMGLIAALSYVGVTILFYFVFEPVSRTLSLVAALVSLAGCVVGALGSAKIVRPVVNPLAFFGVYCLLIGYLIHKSTFLPRALAVFMAIGGIGWLTFAVPRLSGALVPFNMVPGILAETLLTLWLLIRGVDVARWTEQLGASRA